MFIYLRPIDGKSPLTERVPYDRHHGRGTAHFLATCNFYCSCLLHVVTFSWQVLSFNFLTFNFYRGCDSGLSPEYVTCVREIKRLNRRISSTDALMLCWYTGSDQSAAGVPGHPLPGGRRQKLRGHHAARQQIHQVSNSRSLHTLCGPRNDGVGAL